MEHEYDRGGAPAYLGAYDVHGPGCSDGPRYNAAAEPFDWTFTRDDLNDLLDRLAVHDSLTPARLPAAA